MSIGRRHGEGEAALATLGALYSELCARMRRRCCASGPVPLGKEGPDMSTLLVPV